MPVPPDLAPVLNRLESRLRTTGIVFGILCALPALLPVHLVVVEELHPVGLIEFLTSDAFMSRAEWNDVAVRLSPLLSAAAGIAASFLKPAWRRGAFLFAGGAVPLLLVIHGSKHLKPLYGDRSDAEFLSLAAAGYWIALVVAFAAGSARRVVGESTGVRTVGSIAAASALALAMGVLALMQFGASEPGSSFPTVLVFMPVPAACCAISLWSRRAAGPMHLLAIGTALAIAALPALMIFTSASGDVTSFLTGAVYRIVLPTTFLWLGMTSLLGAWSATGRA